MSITKCRFFSVQSALFIAISMLGTASAVQLDATVTQASGPEADSYALGSYDCLEEALRRLGICRLP